MLIAWKPLEWQGDDKVLDEAGFDLHMESPIIKHHVDNIIMPFLLEKENEIEEKLELLYYHQQLHSSYSSSHKGSGFKSVRNSELISNSSDSRSKKEL